MACFLRNKKGFTPLEDTRQDKNNKANPISGSVRENKALYPLTGFTLVEITVAIFILSVGIFGTLSMFAYGVKVMKNSQLTTVANQLAEEKIEETISKDYDEIAVGTSDENSFAPPFSAFRRETRITYADPGVGLQETSEDKGAKKIEVTVFWKSLFGSIDKNIKITTLAGKR